MPFNARTVGEARRTITLTVITDEGEQNGQITYRLKALSGSLEGVSIEDWLIAGYTYKDDQGQERQVPAAIVAWDVTFGDGEPMPPTAEGRAEALRRGEWLPDPILAAFYRAILDDARPNGILKPKSDNI